MNEMNPKEKAEELISQFTHTDSATWVAKEHALLCVDEIVKALQANGDEYWSSDYWEEVKQNINDNS